LKRRLHRSRGLRRQPARRRAWARSYGRWIERTGYTARSRISSRWQPATENSGTVSRSHLPFAWPNAIRLGMRSNETKPKKSQRKRIRTRLAASRTGL